MTSPTTSPITSAFVEQLSVIDCAYLDAARGLVGESWIVDVELGGALDEQSMVLDFGEVKRRLKAALDQACDHRLLVPAQHPGLGLAHHGGSLGLHFEGPAAGAIEHCAPADAVALVAAAHIDAGSLAAHLQPLLARELPASVSHLQVLLRTEAIDGAYYHYAHGLRKHRGQCQRIAHGHRSRLQVRRGGERDLGLEAAWAAGWRDIYLGTREHLVEAAGGRLRFAYRAADGEFMLELPEARCALLDGDSTVERIAEHIALRLSADAPDQTLEVRAYEGVMKGAVARARGGRLA